MFALAGLYVFAVWVWGADAVNTSFNGDPRSPLAGLIYGTANKPFVSRALVPAATRLVVGALPDSARTWITETLTASPKFLKEAARLGWDLRALPEYIVALSFACASLIAFPFVMRRLVRELYETDRALETIFPVLLLLGLPPFFRIGTHYIYDFPAMLFFSLGFLLLLQRKWALFYPVYVLGCFNKETMVLLSFATVLLFWRRLPWKTPVGHAVIQVAIFVLIKLILVGVFAANDGGEVEFHLWGNIHHALLPYSIGGFFTAYLLVYGIAHDFDRKPWALRRAAWLLLPFSLLLVTFAWAEEIRDLYEIYPLYALLVAHTVFFSLMKIPFALRERDGISRVL
jgi:hypothetical protein